MTNLNDGCKNKPCGCEDTPLTSAAPCNPVGCPEPYPCSEVIDAQCVIYTGEDITCNEDVVVSQDMTVAEAIQSMTEYFCNTSDIITANILCGQDIVVPANTMLPEAIELVVDYFCTGSNDTGWVDLQGFAFYQGAMATQRPQVRRIGKQVYFRGNLYVPLTNGSSIINLTASNTYESIPRKTPFVGSGGVFINSSNRIFFNGTGSAAGVVIPTSVLDSGTNLDGNYKLTREVATRRIVVTTSPEPSAEEGIVLLHSYVEVSILSNKTLQLTTLSALESDATYTTDYRGSSALRSITSSFNSRDNIINYKEFLFGQSGTNSTSQSILTSGVLIPGYAYFIADFNAGDNFTNVGATANASGQFFIASGILPTTWTNGSKLITIPQSVHTRGLFFNDPVATNTASTFPLFLDGSYVDASEPLQVGGFVISLDGLTAFIQ